ncbi:MAG: hypothetical protein LBR65_07015 [Culturomica sp.]|jgi:hypothetical protein|nr:hypothetical protein [Culturomica sp.]
MIKKFLFLVVVTAVTMRSLPAQDTVILASPNAWLDFHLVQHIGLGKWNSAGYANEGLPSASMTELRGVFTFFIAKPALHAFMDMGIGIMPAPGMKSLDISRMPMPNEAHYYLREIRSESGPDKASAHFKFTAGLSWNLQASDKLNILPALGVGGLTMQQRQFDLILKEQGSNTQYHTTYVWGKHIDEEYGSTTETLGYLTGRLNFKYKMQRMSLLFGVEYTCFFDRMHFYGRYSNMFYDNIQKDIQVKGNNMNMLGISVSASF